MQVIKRMNIFKLQGQLKMSLVSRKLLTKRLTCWYQNDTIIIMPPKIKQLIKELERAGFINRGGKGSHRNFVHPKVVKPVAISEKVGDDALKYQERDVKKAIEESTK